jgi:hypothetical protein
LPPDSSPHFSVNGVPDFIVALGIAAMNADAACEVWTAREECRAVT